MPLPDPNQEPTVAQFTTPPPAGAKQGPPKVAQGAMARIAGSAPAIARVMAAVQQKERPTAEDAAQLLAALGMAMPTGGAEGDAPRVTVGQAVEQRGERREQQQRGAEGEGAQAKRGPRQYLNSLGLAVMQRQDHAIPSTRLVVVFDLTGEAAEIQGSVRIMDEEDEEQEIVALGADPTQLGDLIYRLILRAQKILPEPEDDEDDIDLDSLDG